MSDAVPTSAFEPRSFLKNPTHFGSEGDVAFSYPSKAVLSRGRLGAIAPETAMTASQFQHVIARKIRARIRSGPEKNVKNFILALMAQNFVLSARTTQTDPRPAWRRPYDLVNGWLAGERTLRADDVALMRRALGWGILPSDEEMKEVEKMTPDLPTASPNTKRRPPPDAVGLAGAEALEAVFGPGDADEWFDVPTLSAEELAKDRRFDAEVAAVAVSYLHEAALAIRRTGPEELWEYDPDEGESSYTVSPARIYQPAKDDRFVDGQCGYSMAHVEAFVDDDWVGVVARPGWAVIDGHFVAKVTAWAGEGTARRPTEVTASRLTEIHEGEFFYSSARAAVSFRSDGTGELAFSDGRLVVCRTSP